MHGGWECTLVQRLWKTARRCLRKLNRASLGPSNCNTRFLPKEHQNTNPEGHVHPDAYSSTTYNSQIVNVAQASTNRGADKENVVYAYAGTLLSHKKV